MVKWVESFKHLLEEGEELLFSISTSDRDIYHMLVYNKNFNMMLYFQAIRYIDKYIRENEEVITSLSLKKKLSHLLSENQIKVLESLF